MRGSIEVSRKVIEENTALPAMLAVVPLKVMNHSFEGEVHTLAFQTGSIVIDERRGVERNEIVVTEALLDRPFRDMDRADMPELSPLHDGEVNETLSFEGSSHQLFMEIDHLQKNGSEEPLS